jgi:cobalt-precorrin-7 (C5)-methyltransferase
MESKIKVVGTGPGNMQYLTPLALETIKAADVLVGGRKQLKALASPGQEQFVIGNNLAEVVRFLGSRGQKQVAVLASGDPGLFSIGSYLAQELGTDDLEFIPGISSVQLMFARLKRPWQDVLILSAHGRSLENIDVMLGHTGVTALLTGGAHDPQAIALYLLERGMPDASVAIGKSLSYPEEIVIHTSLLDLSREEGDYSNSIMVVWHER